MALPELLAGSDRLLFGRAKHAPSLEHDCPVQPADAWEDGEGMLLCPAQCRIGPLRSPVEVAKFLTRGDEAAVHLARRKGPEPPFDGEEHGLV